MADVLQLAIPAKITVVDSTLLVDLYDMEAQWGHTDRGKFRGVKFHAVVNQLGLPLRALVTPGNRFDGLFLSKLIEDLGAGYALADEVYCLKANFVAVGAINALPMIADNSCKKGKNRKKQLGAPLEAKLFVVEQFNGMAER